MTDQTTMQATNSGAEHAESASQNVPQCPNGRGGDNLSDAQSSAGRSDAQLHAIELLIAGTAPSKVAEECFIVGDGTTGPTHRRASRDEQ